MTLARRAALALLLAAASPAEAQAPARMDSATAAATLDTVWATVRRSHWDTAMVGARWDAARDELRPRAAAARTHEELRAVLGELLGRLGQSHFDVVPGEEAGDDAGPSAGGAGTAGLDVRVAPEGVVVTRVERDGPAWAAGIRPGWMLDAVDGHSHAAEAAALAPGWRSGRGRDAETALVTRVLHRLSGPVGSAAALRLRDGGGRAVERTVTRTAPPGTRTRYGNFPETVVRLEVERVGASRGVDVGVIRFSAWFPVLSPGLDAAVDSLRGTDGMVIDLRGNPGGLAAMVMGFAGHFLERPDTLGTMRTRGALLAMTANPRRVDTASRPVRPYAGPVAILVDGLSASTSEFFTLAMQGLGRARVFGERSAGKALPAQYRGLPSGDGLVYAVADFTGPRGQRLEGPGVVPDDVAPHLPDFLLVGIDLPLEAAVRWIAEQRRPAADRAPAGTPAPPAPAPGPHPNPET